MYVCCVFKFACVIKYFSFLLTMLGRIKPDLQAFFFFAEYRCCEIHHLWFDHTLFSEETVQSRSSAVPALEATFVVVDETSLDVRPRRSRDGATHA
jgi:hypothetical protein